MGEYDHIGGHGYECSCNGCSCLWVSMLWVFMGMGVHVMGVHVHVCHVYGIVVIYVFICPINTHICHYRILRWVCVERDGARGWRERKSGKTRRAA